MSLVFQEYRPRKIVNTHKHTDAWFWTKYSAHPYIGCRSGCEFCYLRGGTYLGRRDPATFDSLIQVKINTIELLRKELARLKPDVIGCGDWQQPAEDRYQLSRAMLEVLYELDFPLFVVERSPLLTRDIDLLTAIQQKTWAGIVLSFSHTDEALKRAFEPRAPGLQRRWQMMAQLAQAGLLVGTSLMPILPFIGDGERHLEDVVWATKDNGGTFILAGGLTVEGVQAERSLAAAQKYETSAVAQWRKFYAWPEGSAPQSYGPPRAYHARLLTQVRELCHKHGLLDRMPRYIPPGPVGFNKRLAERLFLKLHDLELAQAANNLQWIYRQAAWAVDAWPESVAELYAARGVAGLQTLPNISPAIATELAGWLNTENIL
jgi:DNA repair photolyase